MPRSISVAMVVRDGLAPLAESLSGIAGIADEVRMVDTGVHEEVTEAGRRLNVKATCFIWCDDSSAVRNESLRGCTGHWILTLDANERIGRDDLPKVRTLAEGPLTQAYRFPVRHYTNCDAVPGFQRCAADDPNARGFAGWYEGSEVRLFPNGGVARFEGLIEESVAGSLDGQGIRVVSCDAPIHRYPFLGDPGEVLGNEGRYPFCEEAGVPAGVDDARGYAQLGDRYAEGGDHRDAVAAYRQSLKRDPANAEVLKNFGRSLRKLTRREDAKRALRLALQLRPGLAEAWGNLGILYADQKEWPLSVECFTRGMASDAFWADGPRYLSLALEGSGRIGEAAKAARQAVEMNPASLEALTLYVHQMVRLERRGEARAFLEGLIEAGARQAELRNAVGELCYYDELYDEAVGHFAEAAQAGLACAHNNLGVVYCRQQRYIEARDAFENCLAKDPGNRGARTNLERILQHVGAEQAG